jgi:hypothetical protein
MSSTISGGSSNRRNCCKSWAMEKGTPPSVCCVAMERDCRGCELPKVPLFVCLLRGRGSAPGALHTLMMSPQGLLSRPKILIISVHGRDLPSASPSRRHTCRRLGSRCSSARLSPCFGLWQEPPPLFTIQLQLDPPRLDARLPWPHNSSPPALTAAVDAICRSASTSDSLATPTSSLVSAPLAPWSSSILSRRR